MLQVLREHEKEIGWTLADIPGISLSMCMNQVLLEDDAKTVRQPINSLILNIMKNEIYIALEDGENITFTCSFDTFTYRRMFFDPGIKREGNDKNFKVNGHCLEISVTTPHWNKKL